MAFNIWKNEYIRFSEFSRVAIDLVISVSENPHIADVVTEIDSSFTITASEVISSNEALWFSGFEEFEINVFDTVTSLELPRVMEDFVIGVHEYASIFNNILLWDNWDIQWDNCLTSWDELTDPRPQEVVILVWDINIRILTGEVIDSQLLLESFNAAQTLTATRPAISQAYSSNGGPLTTVSFYLSKKGIPPSGTLRAEIHTATGTVGSTAVPGAFQVASTPINTSVLTSEYDGTIASIQEVTFDFTIAEFTLTSGVDYCVVIRYTP